MKENSQIKSKSKKIYWLEKIYSFLFEFNYVKFNSFRWIIYGAIYIEVLQVLSYQFQILKTGPNDPNHGKFVDYNWTGGYQILFSISRPSSILQKLEMHELLYLVIISVCCFIYGLLIVFALLFICHKYQVKFQLIAPIQKLVFVIFCYYNQCIFTILFDCFTYIIFQSSFSLQDGDGINRLEGDGKGSGLKVLCGFSLLFMIFISMFSIRWVEQSYSFTTSHNQRTEATSSYLLSMCIKTALSLIYSIKPEESKVTQYLIVALTIIYFYVIMTDFYHELPFTNIRIIKFYFSAQCAGFVVSIIAPFFTVMEVIDEVTFFLIVAMVVPLCFKIAFQKSDEKIKNILYSLGELTVVDASSKSQNLNQKSYQRQQKYIYLRIGLVSQNLEYFMRDSQKMYLVGFYQNHLIRCNDQSCFCKNSSIIKTDLQAQLASDTENKGEFQQEQEDKERSQVNNYLVSHAAISKLLNNQIKISILIYMNQKTISIIHFTQLIDSLIEFQQYYFIIEKIMQCQNTLEQQQNKFLIYEMHFSKLLQVIKTNLREHQTKNMSQESIILTCQGSQSFIKISNRLNKIYQGIVRCIGLKINIYENMLKSYDNMNHFYRQCEEFTIAAAKTLKQMLQLSEAYNTKQHQSVLAFIYSEVFSNFDEANQIARVHNYNDLTHIFNSNQFFFNIFRSDIVSMTLTYGKIWGKIVSYDPVIPKLLGFSTQEFDYIKDIRDLLPSYLARHHNEFIKYMFERNSDHITHTKRKIFVRTKTNFYVHIEVYVDNNNSFKQEFPLIFYIRIVSSQFGHMIISNENKLEGFDQNMFTLVKQTEVKQLPSKISFDVVHIIPEFQIYTDKFKQDRSLTFIDFYKVPVTWPQRQHQIYLTYFSEQTQNQEFVVDPNQNRMTLYEADIVIQIRRIPILQGEFIYYIVELRNLNKVKVLKSQYSNDSYQLNTKTHKVIVHSNLSQQATLQNQQSMGVQINSDRSIEAVQRNQNSNHSIKLKAGQSHFSNRGIANQKSNGSAQDQAFGQILTSQNSEDFKPRPSQSSQKKLTLNQLKQHIKGPPEKPAIDECSLGEDACSEIQEEQNIVNQNIYSIGKGVLQTGAGQNNFFIADQSKAQEFSQKNISLLEQSKGEETSMSTIHQQMSQSINPLLQLETQQECPMQDQISEGHSLSDMEDEKNDNSNNNLKEVVQQDTDVHEEMVIEHTNLKQLLIQNNFDDTSSQQSLTSDINSQITKFKFFNEFTQNKQQIKSLWQVLYTRYITQIVSVIIIIIMLIVIFKSFNSNQVSIKQLSFIPDLIVPLTNSVNQAHNINTTFCNPDYASYRNMTQTSFQHFYDLLRESIKADFQNQKISKYFTEHKVQIMDTDIETYDVYYNMTFLQAINTIIDKFAAIYTYAEADWKDEKKIKEYEFNLQNIQNLFNLFISLAEHMSIDQKETQREVKSQIIYTMVALNVVVFLIYLASLKIYHNFTKDIHSFLQLIRSVQIASVEHEIDYLTELLVQIHENQQLVKSYDFSIRAKIDQQATLEVQSQNNPYLQQAKNQKRKQLFVQVNKEHIYFWSYLIISTVIYISFLIFTACQYVFSVDYLIKFEPAIEYYNQFTGISSYIPICYYIKNHYRFSRNNPKYPYNTSLIIQQLSQPLQQIKLMDQQISNIYSIDFYPKNIQDAVTNFVTMDLCQIMRDPNDHYCRSADNGILTNGIRNVFTKWYNRYRTYLDYGGNYLLLSDTEQVDFDEGFISQRVSTVLEFSYNKLYEELIRITNKQSTSILILTICYSVFMLQFILITIFLEKKLQNNILHNSKQTIFCMPSNTLITEETFYKITKSLNNRLNLIN